MNEISNALKVVNTTVKTVRIIDITRKLVISAAAALCCFFAIRFWRR
ncbi:MAG: hypothetical protein IJB45_03235 [Clostridia bacterium]|nr:hypothetical protein [Clostridia bacterium]